MCMFVELIERLGTFQQKGVIAPGKGTDKFHMKMKPIKTPTISKCLCHLV